MPQPKLNLIYIASIGRSGTTLFESILGAHSQIETCGEIHIWPHEIAQGGVRPCGSGLYVQDDPFWREMERRVDPFGQPNPPIHHFREFHNHGYTLRLQHLPAFTDPQAAAPDRDAIQQYAQNNDDMFRTFADLVAEETGSRPLWLVDASKDPYRLLWLHLSGLFNLKVFHMVKSPPGFVYSVTKEWLDSDDPLRALKRLYYTSRQSLAWVIQNHLISTFTQHHLAPDDHTLLQYEAFAAAPHETVQAACQMLGLPYEPAAVANFREGTPFTIAGNPMRYRSGGIRLDEKWKRRLPESSRRVAGLVTGLTRARYGY